MARPDGGDGHIGTESVDDCGVGLANVFQRRDERVRHHCHGRTPWGFGLAEVRCAMSAGRLPGVGALLDESVGPGTQAVACAGEEAVTSDRRTARCSE
ncbi:hypothetical protein GCM10010307_69380 [Streptomyces vastus]|uniref:Uncharacterized protein n=1 Tax=Streptomyces vastus TaxID=285451 RepID=A0ABN3RMW7_9ACTN